MHINNAFQNSPHFSCSLFYFILFALRNYPIFSLAHFPIRQIIYFSFFWKIFPFLIRRRRVWLLNMHKSEQKIKQERNFSSFLHSWTTYFLFLILSHIKMFIQEFGGEKNEFNIVLPFFIFLMHISLHYVSFLYLQRKGCVFKGGFKKIYFIRVEYFRARS